MDNHSRTISYTRMIWALLFLFCLRVAGQLIQVVLPVDFLPALEHWQGSRLPYGWLLAIQITIVGAVAITAWRLSAARMRPRRTFGRVLLLLGALYFGLMLGRLVLGWTLLAHVPWFAKSIPAFFHLVLASIVLLVGHFHWRYGPRDG